MVNNLLFQLIEFTIDPIIGGEGYLDSDSFHTEQLANPSRSPMQLLTALAA